MLEPNFSSKSQEAEIYKNWEDAGAFKPDMEGNKAPYSMVIPPPNVTGSLHLGHALNNTLQDILARFERMRGKSVLWQPGLDHAGIATQMVVERQLAQAGGNESRASLGREKFIERVWQWKAESGGTIVSQLKRLGASCDWSRERFTMDEGLSEAVLKVFVQLHKEGLIYRAKRLVNWDPHFETAISDLEVINEEKAGHFWHFKYPLENGETYEFPIAYDEEGNPTEYETRNYISIATTRPETMLGDGAVAVHPSDKRYASIVGKKVLLPLADRYIPIIADEYPDPDFGSGAVKITGAHDFNDYKVAQRHNLPMYELMDTKARMADADFIPAKYRGLDRFEARKQIVADIDELGLLLEVEDKTISQPIGDRSGVVIEPMLTDQWYVDAKTLSVPALEAVKSGNVTFTPDNWKETYFQWLENIEPWCISRQLWWGHRIPAWYDENGNIFVELTEEEAQKAADEKNGAPTKLKRDEDVLDTWFSSGLWPFSTLGWPEKTEYLDKFYPTTTLVTMFDIIFFWVARMMMMGIHFTGKAPFKNIIIHSRVVDEKGKKMSKSKGNIIDPVPLIDEYGADALRFCLAIAAGPGRDIRMSAKRVEGYRNFGTKLWNAARFCQMNECVSDAEFNPENVTHTLNKWIVSQVARTAKDIERNLESFRFDEAAGTLYSFIWNIFCDWYLELIKPLLNGEDEELKAETRKTAAWVIDEILKLLHPFMPFITEELWGKVAEFGHGREDMLINQAWPKYPLALINDDVEKEIAWVIDLISGIRSLRAETNINAGTKITAILVGGTQDSVNLLEKYQDVIDRLARLEYSTSANETPKGSVTFVHNEAVVALPLAGVLDVEAEKVRLSKEVARCIAEIKKIEGKLGNENFVARAPQEVVDEQKERLAGYQNEKDKYSNALSKLDEI
ncbi:valine--tRNA ligase [Pseudaquidulcibacter saccharophilus]|uniref:valine--tRNA ligase n=1 Tax=Pseudaquidulcibacter saccharophilus TaxID=2831900 RepID=UPI001EFEF396|nr:valine--tRNA ligase [Pseudaquidulcibacter saccharophilus]